VGGQLEHWSSYFEAGTSRPADGSWAMLVRSAPQASSSVGRPRRVSCQRPCRQIKQA